MCASFHSTATDLFASENVGYVWMVRMSLFKPMWCFIATTDSAIISPACSPTIVTPSMRSFPGTVRTLTKPRAASSAIARSSSPRSKRVVS